eukprot:363970-Chlamydomonas_euryale.AAC.9
MSWGKTDAAAGRHRGFGRTHARARGSGDTAAGRAWQARLTGSNGKDQDAATYCRWRGVHEGNPARSLTAQLPEQGQAWALASAWVHCPSPVTRLMFSWHTTAKKYHTAATAAACTMARLSLSV